MLLPMPRQKAEALSLQYHVAFQALRMRLGSAHGLAILLQLVTLAEVLVATERGINAALERASRAKNGHWIRRRTSSSRR
ncbi:hypothetical protein WM24_15905 [Burkholderia ubonensis]|nr:hypothetical protein WM24_15905 [Burkholderia ubonensis]